MCDSSETADALAASTELSSWEHTTGSTQSEESGSTTQDLGKYSPKSISGAGNYIVLINGSTDAAFAITNAKWTTATGSNAVPGATGTSIAIEGSIQVAEPKGVAFLDQVVKCSVALGVDSSQVVYVLKTFFVGYGIRADGGQSSEYVEHISDVPPLICLLIDATGSFTEAGGTYEMQFVGAGHGATRLPQYSKAVNAMSIVAGNSLEQTLTRLQDNINDNYNKYFDCVYAQIEAASGSNKELLNSLRRVKYEIVVGKDYSDAEGARYTVTDQPQQYKSNPGCNDPAQITFPSHVSIETAINMIMMMSPQVKEDMATGDTTGRAKYEFKVHTALVSKQSPSADSGNKDYTVYYRVERIITPKTIAFAGGFETLALDENERSPEQRDVFQGLAANIIEFDYLYTGKNIDILELDMKVNLGLAYLQTATLVNTFKSQVERAPNRQTQPSAQDANGAAKFGKVVQTPVFFGSQIRTPGLTNTNNAGNTIQSAYTLAKHASLEVTESTMRIIGNTSLLGSVNKTSSPKYVVESADSTKRGKATEGSAGQRESEFAEWSHIPAYVKVRIKMPRDNDDYALFTGQGSTGSTDYARDFWFDGYYYVVGIDHMFESGEFSQTLHLIGIPKRSAFEASKESPKEVSLNKSVGSCYDNVIIATPSESGAGTRAPSTAVVPVTPPAGNTEPTNRADAKVINQSNTGRSVTDVIGWDKASDAVKNAILQAAARTGMNQVTLAQMAAVESRFDPRAQPRTSGGGLASSALGLYQFLKATWNGEVRKGAIPGLTTANGLVDVRTIAPDGPTDPRYDPGFNAMAGAAFLKANAAIIGSSDVGDLYLAHFMGPGTARKVISADNSSGGKQLLSATIGADQTSKIARANPSFVTVNSTVGEVRAEAARRMARKLKNGITTAPQRTTTPTAAPGTTQGSTQPSADPTTTQRPAATALGVQQNAQAQAGKTDIQPCGPTAPTDRPTRGGQ